MAVQYRRRSRRLGRKRAGHMEKFEREMRGLHHKHTHYTTFESGGKGWRGKFFLSTTTICVLCVPWLIFPPKNSSSSWLYLRFDDKQQQTSIIFLVFLFCLFGTILCNSCRFWFLDYSSIWSRCHPFVLFCFLISLEGIPQSHTHTF